MTHTFSHSTLCGLTLAGCPEAARFQRPCFQLAHRYPRGFISTWSGLHSSSQMLECASGLVQVELNLVAWFLQSLQIQWDHQCPELISLWEMVTHYLPAEAMETWVVFRSLQLHHVFYFFLKIEHHFSKQLLLYLERPENKKNHLCCPKLNWCFPEKNPFSCDFCQTTIKINVCCWQIGDIIYLVAFVQGGAKAFRYIEVIVETTFFPFLRMSKNNFAERKAVCLLKLLTHSLREDISVISYLSVLPLCGLLVWGFFNA